jgi:hypothetical protein
MIPTTPEEYDRWKLDRKLLDGVLKRVEDAERMILEDLNCPTDPAEVDEMLSGRRTIAPGVTEPVRPSWPRGKRVRERVIHARNVLALVSQVRSHVTLGSENALKAAHDALLAGIYAGDSATNAVIAVQERKGRHAGGLARGAQKADDAKRHDSAIARYDRQWHNSDELQEQYGYRSSVPYIKKKTSLDTRTIQRALKRLRMRQ